GEGGGGGGGERGGVEWGGGGSEARPGDVVTTVVTQAAPHYLIADLPPRAVRRTRGGDAWQARKDGLADPGAAGATTVGPPVLLGMPAIGRPGPRPPGRQPAHR